MMSRIGRQLLPCNPRFWGSGSFNFMVATSWHPTGATLAEGRSGTLSLSCSQAQTVTTTSQPIYCQGGRKSAKSRATQAQKHCIMSQIQWVTTLAVQPTFSGSDCFSFKSHGRQLAPRADATLAEGRSGTLSCNTDRNRNDNVPADLLPRWQTDRPVWCNAVQIH